MFLRPATPTPDETFSRALGAVAIVFGAAAAAVYARAGLTLSHYDAKAHLVVARRVLDSLTPEWSQVGAVWLPLPHLLNLLPVQVDWLYRTGASAVAISVVSFGLVCYAAAKLILQMTGSRLGALAAVAILALDPNLLYLQSTPMTEALLFGLLLLAISLLHDWVAAGAARAPHAAGWAFAAACLTRYEAWFVTIAAIGLAGLALVRQGSGIRQACGAVLRLTCYPALAVAAFMLHSRYTIGRWFVTGGFFVADNRAQGHPLDALVQVAWGVRQISGTGFAIFALAAAGVLAVQGLHLLQCLRGPTPARSRSGWLRRKTSVPRGPLPAGQRLARAEGSSHLSPVSPTALVTLSLLAFMALPSYAFFEGHPFRMRYMIAPSVAVAVLGGAGVGVLRRAWRIGAALAIAIALASTARPFDRAAPMLVEAQWDRPNSLGRRTVTGCLMSGYHGEPILVSMGSLAHYMQELSHEGLNIRDFVHEGNKPFWPDALKDPRGRVGWILMEEKAEGGDMLAMRAKTVRSFLDGFRRTCEGGGVALYEAID